MTNFLTVLIRYHLGRKPLMDRCMESVTKQSEWINEVLVSYQTEEEFKELLDYGFKISRLIKVEGDTSNGECFFNLFLNNLKSEMKDGTFALILDSDNWLIDGALEKLSKVLTNPDEIIILQFLRKTSLKPTNRMIDEKRFVSGKIDSASICFHSKYKDVAMFAGNDNADWAFCKEMTEKCPTKWIKLPVVQSDRRSRGLNF